MPFIIDFYFGENIHLITMLKLAKMYQYLHQELRNIWVIKNMNRRPRLFDLLGPNGKRHGKPI